MGSHIPMKLYLTVINDIILISACLQMCFDEEYNAINFFGNNELLPSVSGENLEKLPCFNLLICLSALSCRAEDLHHF